MIFSASDDKSHLLEDTTKTIIDKIGKPRNYGLTTEEMEEIMLKEEERKKQEEQEVQSKEEEMKKRAHEERMIKMEEWLAVFGPLQFMRLADLVLSFLGQLGVRCDPRQFTRLGMYRNTSPVDAPNSKDSGVSFSLSKRDQKCRESRHSMSGVGRFCLSAKLAHVCHCIAQVNYLNLDVFWVHVWGQFLYDPFNRLATWQRVGVELLVYFLEGTLNQFEVLSRGKMNDCSIQGTLLNTLKEEEEELLTVQGTPLRHYLMRYVFPVLTKGLMEVARVRPSDPVDYLAEFLFRENPEGKMFQPEIVEAAQDLLEVIYKLKDTLTRQQEPYQLIQPILDDILQQTETNNSK
uniref:Uncharacterized protein n=1 Tax=Timema bartmani TaxID=61472 RepID=A0A7R9ESN7_9NEOP|nr:unnamed protein product [Timema bartmani]